MYIEFHVTQAGLKMAIWSRMMFSSLCIYTYHLSPGLQVSQHLAYVVFVTNPRICAHKVSTAH